MPAKTSLMHLTIRTPLSLTISADEKLYEKSLVLNYSFVIKLLGTVTSHKCYNVVCALDSITIELNWIEVRKLGIRPTTYGQNDSIQSAL
jgi:hypothetical protein